MHLQSLLLQLQLMAESFMYYLKKTKAVSRLYFQENQPIHVCPLSCPFVVNYSLDALNRGDPGLSIDISSIWVGCITSKAEGKSPKKFSGQISGGHANCPHYRIFRTIRCT